MMKLRWVYTAWTEDGSHSAKTFDQCFQKVERYYNVQFVYSELFPSGDLISGSDLKDSNEDVMKVLADVAKLITELIRKKYLSN